MIGYTIAWAVAWAYFVTVCVYRGADAEPAILAGLVVSVVWTLMARLIFAIRDILAEDDPAAQKFCDLALLGAVVITAAWPWAMVQIQQV